jgi:hypothetical protein
VLYLSATLDGAGRCEGGPNGPVIRKPFTIDVVTRTIKHLLAMR